MRTVRATPLAVVMKEREVSTSDLAKLLGCTRGYMSRVDRGVVRPSVDFAKKLAAHFKGSISLDEILCPEDHPLVPAKKPAHSVPGRKRARSVKEA